MPLAAAVVATVLAPLAINGLQARPSGAGPVTISPTTYRYVFVQGVAGSAVRAFCAPGEKVSGGGGSSLDPSVGLVQSFPIADITGTNAFGTTAIGWQAATEGFTAPAQAFVICASAA
jgi:hypothetical protein